MILISWLFDKLGYMPKISVDTSWPFPASTSALSYKIQCKTNNSTLYVNRPLNQGGFTDVLKSTITVMEIAA